MKTRPPVKQYLIDITLKTLEINQPVQPPSKVICEIHYEENYLKLKLQPTIKNGLASFYQQKIRIPYSSQIALVFKMQRMKKETFLGHYLIDAQKSLQERMFHYKTKEKLQETEAYIEFEIKIVDKQLFEDDLSDEFEEDEIQLIAKSNYSEKKPLKGFSKEELSKPRSLIDGNLAATKREENSEVPKIPEEFRRKLTQAQDILNKYQMTSRKTQQKQYFSRDSKGSLKTTKILELRDRLQKSLNEQKMNTNILMTIVIGVSFFLGFILA